MPRKRFTQIIDKTNNIIPVGGEAQNITLKDGSVLEEALGEIKLAENGSIMDQLNKIRTDTLTNSYAPLISPYIQQSFYVQQDYITRFATGTTIINAAKGITATRTSKQSNKWTITGTCVGSSAGLVVLFGNGNDATTNIGSAGTYIYRIISNCLEQDKVAVQFLWNLNSNNSNAQQHFVQENDIPEDKNQVTGTFTVPSGYKLNRVSLFLFEAAENTVINGNLTIYLYKVKEDKEALPFSVTMQTNGLWKTEIANTLTVSSYKGIAPISQLGTIKGGNSSNWEGVLNVKANGNSHNGILIEDSGIGFVVSGNTQTQRNRYRGVTSQTDYRIFTGYSSTNSDGVPGIYYDSFKNHNFRIKNSSGGYTNVLNLFPQEIRLSNPTTMTSTVTMKGNAAAEKNLTVQGTTSLKTTTATDLTVSSKFRSNDVPIQANVTTMKQLEQIIEDSRLYPNEQVLLFRLQHNIIYYLTTGGYKSSESGLSSCPAIGFKTSDHNIILYYMGNGKMYRTQYWWPQGQARAGNNRNWSTYSVSVGTDELVGTMTINGKKITKKKPGGKGEKFL